MKRGKTYSYTYIYIYIYTRIFGPRFARPPISLVPGARYPKRSLEVSKITVVGKKIIPFQQSTCQQLPVDKGPAAGGEALKIYIYIYILYGSADWAQPINNKCGIAPHGA